MILATVTFGGICWAVVLVVGMFIAILAFSNAITHGGIFGWWMANSIMDLIGLIFKALIECISSMRD